MRVSNNTNVKTISKVDLCDFENCLLDYGNFIYLYFTKHRDKNSYWRTLVLFVNSTYLNKNVVWYIYQDFNTYFKVYF